MEVVQCCWNPLISPRNQHCPGARSCTGIAPRVSAWFLLCGAANDRDHDDEAVSRWPTLLVSVSDQSGRPAMWKAGWAPVFASRTTGLWLPQMPRPHIFERTNTRQSKKCLAPKSVRTRRGFADSKAKASGPCRIDGRFTNRESKSLSLRTGFN
jgi:hypothetical protein